jgi:hypothetical protein
MARAQAQVRTHIAGNSLPNCRAVAVPLEGQRSLSYIQEKVLRCPQIARDQATAWLAAYPDFRRCRGR